MAEPRRELDLAQEALGPERLADLGLEHLDGDVAAVLQIAGEKHRRHAAFPEHAIERVPIGEGKAQRRPENPGSTGETRHLGVSTITHRAPRRTRGRGRADAGAPARATSRPPGRPNPTSSALTGRVYRHERGPTHRFRPREGGDCLAPAVSIV